MYCISKVHTNMLPKILFIAKVLIQISLVTTGNVKDNVSKTWHRTQVFIYYNKANFDEDHLDCLGTILSRRFILTAATCVMNSDVPLSNAIVFHDKKSYGIEKFTIHQNFDFRAIIPDLSVLKLTKDIESKNVIVVRKLIHFYPQDKAKGIYSNMNVKTMIYFYFFIFLFGTYISDIFC